MSDLQTLRDEAQELFGLDLEDDEADRLYNEADTEFCVQSGWTQGAVDLGPTVADQAAYELPEEVYEPLEVYVNDRPYDAATKRIVKEIGAGTYRLRARGVWWLSVDATGVQSISVYPTPSEALPLEADCVVYPPAMEDDTDTPAAPKNFHRALHEYVQAISLGGSEDDLERKQVHMDEFERQAARCRQHRIRRKSGSGGAQMRVVGLT